MPKTEIKEIIPASANAVFAVLHDYSRRLEWDTLLEKAYLEPEYPEACLGAIAVCQGRRSLGGFAVRTRYVSFQPGKVAAVKMLNYPPFFSAFAASIRHENIGENLSEVIYEYHFKAKPRALRWLLHPVMNRMFHWETKKRLKALKRFFAKQTAETKVV